MDTMKTCPGCRQPLESNAVDGLCPKCLMKAVLDTGVDVGPDTRAGSGHAPFVVPTLEEIARLFPQLEILELIGQGGMGAVYKARQKELDRVVALKILPPGIGDDPAFAERFAREAKALAKLNHPGIVTLYEFGNVGPASRLSQTSKEIPAETAPQGGDSGKLGTGETPVRLYYFLMEYVDGVSLGQLLRSSRVSPREALAIVPQICDALQYAHDAGIVHRDIKPENILLDRRGRVKVADFGLAKLVGTEAGRAGSPLPAVVPPIDDGAHGVTRPTDALTDAGKIMGTPAYMAPEQAEHPGEVDHRADIYALGVVFYQMLTGELPGKPLEPPSSKVQIDVRLDEVVLRALERKPELRYQQVSVLKTQVETIVETSDSSRSRREEAQTEKQHAVENKSQSLLTSSPTSETPRFSRTAFVGACCAALFLVMVLPSFLGHAVLGQYLPLKLLLLLVGTTAPFATTLLGCVAISQIRRSAGRLYGLGLALFDALLFPLLALDVLIGFFWSWIVYDLIRASIIAADSPASALTVLFVKHASEIVMLFTVPVALVLDFFLIRRAWRAVRMPVGSGAGVPPVIPSLPNASAVRFGRLALGLCLVGLVLPVAMTVVHLLTGMRLDRWIWIGAFALAGLFELPALVMGIIGWKSRAGKAAVIASMVMPLLAVIGVATRVSLPGFVNLSAGSADNSPFALRSLPTARVIQTGLAKPQEPWAWQELGRRAQSGQLTSSEAGLILDGLTAWLRRDYPDGFDKPLSWIGGMLGELTKRGLVAEEPALRFLDAIHGRPTCRPLPRLCATDKSLSLTCNLRSSWHGNLLGCVLLNEMRAVTIDGQTLALINPAAVRNWNQDRFDPVLHLPALAPGQHVLKCEIESALIAEKDVVGLAPDASSVDWPPAKRRWTRSCQAVLKIYAEGSEVVSLTQEPALDPVAAGALPVKQVVIHRKGAGASAVVLLNPTDKLPGPISFDVTLRVGGQTVDCGHLWSEKPTAGGVYSRSGDELKADIKPLDPHVKEADIILTPNPKLVERQARIDQIWGREIVFSHVPLARYDLAGPRDGAETSAPATKVLPGS